MKKALAILALLSLATLPSLAAVRQVAYGGYRIGEADVAIDDTRIASLPVGVEDSGPSEQIVTNITVTATKVNGQKIVRWWSYASMQQVAPTQTTPAYIRYNNVVTNAAAVYSLNWTYNTVSYSPAYVVVDYDYIKYNLSYDRNGGSGTLPSTTNNVIYTNEVVVAGGELSRAGYTWVGWTNNLTSTVWTGGETVTGSTLGLQSIVDGSNVVLRAKWTPNTYTVKFDANGGTGSMDNQSFTYGQTKPLTSNAFTRVGYAFNGWATSSEGSKQYDDGQAVGNLTSENGGEVVLYARWSLVYYSLATSATGTGSGTVALSPSGGSYTNGTVVQVTANPADGSTFTQWSDGVTDNPRTYTMTSNISVSAVFAISTYTVTFKDYDDTVLLFKNCNHGETMPYPSADPSREGYVFKGWFPNPPDTVTRTAVYTAQYEAKSYTVRFHANYGAGTVDSTKDQTFTYGISQNLASVSSLKFTKSGYAFAYWKEQGGDLTYEDGEQVLSLADHGIVHLDAQWTPNAYTIAFDGNGADSGSVESIPATYDQTYDLPKNGFVKAGRAFKSWRLGLTGETYAEGAGVSNLTTTAGATVTFYAVWSEPRYIAFDGNGANDAAAMAEDVMTFEGVETKTLVSNKFEKTGYTFAGWATNEVNAAARMTNYVDGAEVVSTNLWMAISETNMLFAVWQTNAYTVVFNANGGTGSMTPQAFVYDQAQPLTTCGFMSNLDFAGWATNQTGDVVFDDQATVSNLTAEADGTATLYAVWDNGELSKAMHCNNLYWTDSGEGTAWGIVNGDGEGFGSSGSAVSNSVTWFDGSSKKLKPWNASPGSGRLSFWYRMDPATGCQLEVNDGSVNLSSNTEWMRCGPVAVEDITEIEISFSSSDVFSHTVWIDQMTWEPAGLEPTEKDKPTISAFEATADGFMLTADNVSASFNYQILATNELVGGDWPVMTNLTSEAIGEGYTIEIDENESQMFYKVKVIAK